MSFKENLKKRIKKLERETLAVWYAARDKRTPWAAKALAILITAYAFSPIDLIPDFIPVLGTLDDLLILPAGIALALKLIPAEVMTDARARANLETQKPTHWAAGMIIALIWLGILFLIGRWGINWITTRP